MENEAWLPAPGYEQWLEVSNLGGVRTFDYLAPSKNLNKPAQMRKGCVLIPDASASTGYPRVCLKRHGQVHRINVHRIVALAFVPGIFEGATVDHIDGVRTNNVASNLRWLTRSENTRAQNADGRGVGRGSDHPGSVLKDEQIPEIFRLRESGLSYAKIADKVGCSGSLIYQIINGGRRSYIDRTDFALAR